MPSTSKFLKTTKGISQHGTNWCIPASIENLLRAEKIMDITQEDLIHEFLLSKNPSLTDPNGGQVQLSSLERFQALEIFRCRALLDINFQLMVPVTNKVLSSKGYSVKLTEINNIKSGNYVSEMENVLNQDKPVLMSAQTSNAWHITIVYEISNKEILSYDPGRDQHLKVAVASYTFSHDILYVA